MTSERWSTHDVPDWYVVELHEREVERVVVQLVPKRVRLRGHLDGGFKRDQRGSKVA